MHTIKRGKKKKKKIETLKKMNKRLIHIKSGINFNNICLKEGLEPTFTNIYIYIYITTKTTHQYICIYIYI